MACTYRANATSTTGEYVKGCILYESDLDIDDLIWQLQMLYSQTSNNETSGAVHHLPSNYTFEVKMQADEPCLLIEHNDGVSENNQTKIFVRITTLDTFYKLVNLTNIPELQGIAQFINISSLMNNNIKNIWYNLCANYLERNRFNITTRFAQQLSYAAQLNQTQNKTSLTQSWDEGISIFTDWFCVFTQNLYRNDSESKRYNELWKYDLPPELISNNRIVEIMRNIRNLDVNNSIFNVNMSVVPDIYTEGERQARDRMIEEEILEANTQRLSEKMRRLLGLQNSDYHTNLLRIKVTQKKQQERGEKIVHVPMRAHFVYHIVPALFISFFKPKLWQTVYSHLKHNINKEMDDENKFVFIRKVMHVYSNIRNKWQAQQNIDDTWWFVRAYEQLFGEVGAEWRQSILRRVSSKYKTFVRAVKDTKFKERGIRHLNMVLINKRMKEAKAQLLKQSMWDGEDFVPAQFLLQTKQQQQNKDYKQKLRSVERNWKASLSAIHNKKQQHVYQAHRFVVVNSRHSLIKRNVASSDVVTVVPQSLHVVQPYLQTPESIPIAEVLTWDYWDGAWWNGSRPIDRQTLRWYHLLDQYNFWVRNFKWLFRIDVNDTECRPGFFKPLNVSIGCKCTSFADTPPLFRSDFTFSFGMCDNVTLVTYPLVLIQLFTTVPVSEIIEKHPGWKPFLSWMVRNDTNLPGSKAIGPHIIPCLIVRGVVMLMLASFLVVIPYVSALAVQQFSASATKMKVAIIELRTAIIEQEKQVSAALSSRSVYSAKTQLLRAVSPHIPKLSETRLALTQQPTIKIQPLL